MSREFDPYHKWLGIPPKDQPAHHYRLLGINLFETDPDVIDSAANRVMAYLKDMASGPHADESQKLLNEVAAARITLLNKEKRKAYDEQLRSELPSEPAPSTNRPPVAKPAAKKKPKTPPPSSAPPTSEPPPATAVTKPASPTASNPELSKALASISSTSIKHSHEEHEKPAAVSPSRQLLIFGGVGAGIMGLAIICLIAFLGGGGDAQTDPSETADASQEGQADAGESVGEAETTPPEEEAEPTEPSVPIGELALILVEDERTTTTVEIQDENGQPVDLAATQTTTLPTHITYLLPAGKYKVVLTRADYETFRRDCNVSESQPSRVVPEWQPKLEGDGHGLIAEYFGDDSFLTSLKTRIDDQVNFIWGRLSPAVGVPTDNFSVRWKGYIKAPQEGNYQLTAIGDDWIRVIVDDNVICEATRDQALGSVYLDDAPHRIEVALRETTLDAHAVLCWELPSVYVRQVIPPSAFFYDRTVAEAANVSDAGLRPVADPATPPLNGAPLDLLEQIDPARDTVLGPWWFDGDVLMCGPMANRAGQLVRLTVPFRHPKGDYMIEADVERCSRPSLFAFGLPSGTSLPAVLCDADPATTQGCRLDGFGTDPAPAGASSDQTVFPLGDRVPLQCAVDRSGVAVKANGNDLIAWHGDTSRLASSQVYSGMPAQRLVLGTDNGIFRIHRLTWRQLGEGGVSSGYPVPPAEQVAAAVQRLKTTYPVASDATDADKLRNAQLILALADDEDTPLSDRYAAFQVGSQLSFDANDVSSAVEHLHACAQVFSIDDWKTVTDQLVDFAKNHTGEEAETALFEVASGVYTSLTQEDRIDLAKTLAEAVHLRAMRAEEPGEAKKLWLERRKQASDGLAAWQAYQQAAERLLSDPADQAAHNVVGQRYCFVQGDWEKGLPHLADGTEGALQDLAAKELAGPAQASEWLVIATGWRSAAEKTKSDDGQTLSILEHTLEIYDKARQARPLAAELNVIDSTESEVQAAVDKLKSDMAITGHIGAFALAFNGKSDYIKTPMPYDGRAMLTVEAFVKPDLTIAGAPRTLIGNYDHGGFALDWLPAQKQWMWTIYSAAAHNMVQMTHPARQTIDKWTHVAAVYANGMTALYVDGVPHGDPLPVGAHKPTPMHIMIGAQPSATGAPEMFFLGEIREIRISNEALYTKAFTPPQDLRPMRSSVIVYQLNEGQGTKATNTSGVKLILHGEIMGAKWVPAR